MGGQGFGQGVVQGLQQAQDRSLQMQQLKLQQDLAKFQQKHMETQDQLGQLQVQSLQHKIQQEHQQELQRQAIPGQLSQLAQPTLGQDQMGPEPDIDRHKLTSLLISAQQAGQDPDQLLSLMSIGDPRIAAIRATLQPKKFGKVGEGETLIDENTGKVVAQGGPKSHVIAPGGSLVQGGQATFTAPAGPAKPPDFGDRTESAAAVYGQQKFGKPMTFAELLAADPIEAGKLRQQTMVEEPATIQGGKTAANIVEQHKRVLHPSEANELGVPFGTTQEQATGIMPITGHQRESLAGYDTSRTIIADIKQYSERVNRADAGVAGRAKQAGKLWGAYTQSDPDAALLQTKMGELASVARSLGEKGALANQDVARAAALVPSVLDTREVAQKKIRDMEQIINNGERNFRKSLGIDARSQGKSRPAQDPLLSESRGAADQELQALQAIPTPPGLTSAQQQVWRQSYAEHKKMLQQKMTPQTAKTP